MIELDARNLTCPAPVLMVKNAIEKEARDDIMLIVDNEAAQENVTRFLESRGFSISIKKAGKDRYVIGKRDENSTSEIIVNTEEPGPKKIMVMISTDRIGSGDDDLGRKLMLAFLKTLNEMGPDLWRIVFVNSGVKLATEGSKALPDLKELEGGELQILVCGTCLNHFGLMDKKKVGITTNMLDIVTAMHMADKVVNF
ncbi:MAG: sulfurtransferase-like selenium metabolism protein YedF [Desulfobulbaceae bacterium]|nr:sulfurtransferase-like selenium metabolism protein YedF [Desulfobulbaceae bacterium]